MSRRGVFLMVAAVYAAVVIPIQLHKGGDLAPELRQSERLLRGEALYSAANRVEGVWWPPFSALALVPFTLLARASLPLAKVAWAITGVACLAWSIAHVRAPTWQRAALATAAVAVPIQTNFEHANINTILLALVVAAAHDLANEREDRAGVWIGLATALKAFPGLLLVYLAYRGRWRAFSIGVVVAASLTALALLPHGAGEAVNVMREWLVLVGSSSELVSASNQSLAALVDRLGGPPAAAGGVALVCLAATAVAFRQAPPDGMPRELAVVTLLAVLLSPIAWVHYYVLLLPAWAAALEQLGQAPRRPVWYAGLAAAALATSGLLTVGPRPLRVALLHASIYAWGALLLLVLLLLMLRRAPQRESPAPIHDPAELP